MSASERSFHNAGPSRHDAIYIVAYTLVDEKQHRERKMKNKIGKKNNLRESVT